MEILSRAAKAAVVWMWTFLPVIGCTGAGTSHVGRICLRTLEGKDGSWTIVSPDGTWTCQGRKGGRLGEKEMQRLRLCARNVVRHVADGAFRSHRQRDYSVEVDVDGIRHVYLLVWTSRNRYPPKDLRSLLETVETLRPEGRSVTAQAVAAGRERLVRVVSDIDVRGRDLEWLCEFLTIFSEVPILVDWASFGETGVAQASKIHLHRKDISAEALLREAFTHASRQGRIRLAFEFSEDGLFLSREPDERDARELATRTAVALQDEPIRFRVIHYEGGDFSLAISRAGGVSYARHPFRKLRGTRRQKFWDLAAKVTAAVPVGAYGAPYLQDMSVEIPGKERTHVYVLVNAGEAPDIPRVLMDITANLSGLLNW